MRRLLALLVLAACAEVPVGENPGLFEPYMVDDRPYNVSFMAAETPPFRPIEVFRMTGDPFGPADLQEAEAVAVAFCNGAARRYIGDEPGVLDARGAFVFARNCMATGG